MFNPYVPIDVGPSSGYGLPSFGAGDAFAYDSTFDSAFPSAPPPWNWTDDEEFRKRLGEAWANNDLAAGYAAADKGSPAPTGRVGEQRRRQPWEMPGSLFATSPVSYNPLIQRRG